MGCPCRTGETAFGPPYQEDLGALGTELPGHCGSYGATRTKYDRTLVS